MISFVKRHNNYALISAILIWNIGCTEIPKDTKTVQMVNRRHGCDLIWDIRQMNQKEIFFRNTCTNPCMVTWRSKNILGIWSPLHYDRIPPQGELSYPV